MFAVCSSCQRFLGRRSPLEQGEIVEEVCEACRTRPRVEGSPTVVVDRKSADTLMILRALLSVEPGFRIVRERRSAGRVLADEEQGPERDPQR